MHVEIKFHGHNVGNVENSILVRTSGILLFASVGSYMMYRVCARLLGRDFIWTILEQARFDMLARDEYLLNSRMVGSALITIKITRTFKIQTFFNNIL